MGYKQRFTLLVSLIGLLLAALILLQPALWANLVAPITHLFWVILRVFLSVHQKLYWGLLLFAAAVYWYMRLVRELSEEQELAAPEGKSSLESADHWRSLMTLTEHEAGRANSLKGELAALLVAIAAARQHVQPAQHAPGGSELYDAFRQGRIPLAAETRAFLFPEPEPPGRSLWHGLQRIWHTPRPWLDHLTGRDKAAYYQSIDEALSFMEAFMESNDDDRPAPRIY